MKEVAKCDFLSLPGAGQCEYRNESSEYHNTTANVDWNCEIKYLNTKRKLKFSEQNSLNYQLATFSRGGLTWGFLSCLWTFSLAS